MMKTTVLILTFCMLIPFHATAFAGDIEQGTVSVEAASNLFFNYNEDDINNKGTSLSFAAQTGYFLAKNFEIGMGLQIDLEDDGNADSQIQSVMCFIGYHYSLTKKSNLFARLGGGIGSGKARFDDIIQYGRGIGDAKIISFYNEDKIEADVETLSAYGEIGYELLLTKNAAVDLSVTANRSWSDYILDNGSESTEIGMTRDNVRTQLKFKLYF